MSLNLNAFSLVPHDEMTATNFPHEGVEQGNLSDSQQSYCAESPPMSRWWRAYEEAVDDPKLQRLNGDLFKSWFNLLCLSSRNHGILPSISDISFGLRKPENECQQDIDTLISFGLFDNHNGKISPHNWSGRQFKSDTSTPRVQQFRKRQRNVSGNGHETFHVTHQSRADTDSEQKKESQPREGKD